MNFWAPKPKCHYPSTHSGFKDDENRLPSCHSGCYGAVGTQPNPDRQWQPWPLCPTLPCLFLSSLILLSNVTCAPHFFFFLLFCPAKYPHVASFVPSLWEKHLLQIWVLKLLSCSRICLHFCPHSAKNWAETRHRDASPITPAKQEPVWFPSIHWETAGDPVLSH